MDSREGVVHAQGHTVPSTKAECQGNRATLTDRACTYSAAYAVLGILHVCDLGLHCR